MNPTLYDILGLSPDAGADEIKRAWRDAADRFEPGSGGGPQFKLFNEAAEVLLDPQRRRAYDEQLAAAADDEEQAPEETAPGRSAARTVSAVSAPPPAPEAPGDAVHRAGAPLWLVLVLAVLALGLVAAAAILGLPAWKMVHAENQQQQATRTAPSAAERAATAILSYDYTSLDTDEKAAERYMTDKYKLQYADTFDSLVRDNATKLHAKVVAQVTASGVSDASNNRVNVLLFANQTTTSTANNGDPQVALNRVLFSMTNTNGTWLVNNITSY